MTPRTLYAITILAISLWTLPSARSAEFFGLGDLPGGPFESRATDISSDGNVVVGYSAVDTYEYRPGNERSVVEAFRWTRESGMQTLGTLPGHSRSRADGVSADGSVIVGYSNEPGTSLGGSLPSEAFRWAEEQGMVGLGHLPSFCTGSWAGDVSDDGTTIIGLSFAATVPRYGCVTEAFRFVDDTMMGLGYGEELHTDMDLNESETKAVSFDGSIIAGESNTRSGDGDPWDMQTLAWLWHEATGELTDIGRLGGHVWTNISAMTPDGRVVTGVNRTPGQDLEPIPFIWTQLTSMVPLDVPTTPKAISDDGSIIAGDDFIWTEQTGAIDLVELLTNDLGLAGQLAGWQLDDVNAISGNGRAIVGRGTNPHGNTEAWMLVLDPALQAGDADQDWDFDQLDLVQVQVSGKYLTGEPATWGEGDWNGAPVMFSAGPPVGDGLFNQLDIVAAQQAGLYLAGSYAAVQVDTFVALPEPSGFLLTGMGFLGVLFCVLLRVKKGSHINVV